MGLSLRNRRRAALSLLLAVLASCAPGNARRSSLTVLLSDDVLSLDPNRDVEQVTDSVLINVFEPLVGFDEDLQLRTILAESWEHPEPERWRFHLRRDLTFQDGTPLTAPLVRDCLLAVKRDSQDEASQFLSEVDDIAAPSDSTVDIVTREPRAILASLPFVYVTKRNAGGDFPPLVGTGPYRIRSRTPGRSVVLERWPDYSGPRPEFAQAVYEPLRDAAARLARLRDGTADIVYRVPPELAQPAPGVRFLRRAGLTVSYLGFNLRKKPGNPFRDVRVRKAFHLALDRDALVERGLMGRGAVATQPVAPLIFGYNPDLPKPEHDPARARELMAEAGHPKGFKLRLDYSLGRLPAPGLIQESLRDIGVDLQLNGLDRADFFKLAESGESDFFFAGWDCSSGEASEFYEVLLHTPARRYGLANYGAYSNPRIDEIAETNAATLDQRARKEMLQEAAAVTMADLPILPLFVADIQYGLRDDLTFPPRADSEVKLSDVRFADPGAQGR